VLARCTAFERTSLRVQTTPSPHLVVAAAPRRRRRTSLTAQALSFKFEFEFKPTHTQRPLHYVHLSSLYGYDLDNNNRVINKYCLYYFFFVFITVFIVSFVAAVRSRTRTLNCGAQQAGAAPTDAEKAL